MQKQKTAIELIQEQINELERPKRAYNSTKASLNKDAKIKKLRKKIEYFEWLKENQNILSQLREIIEKRGFLITKISRQSGISMAPLFNYIKHGYLNDEFEIINHRGQIMRETNVRVLHAWIQENK